MPSANRRYTAMLDDFLEFADGSVGLLISDVASPRR
jgi:hypothetical protein